MKKSEAIFVLHGDVTRKSKILSLIGDDAYIVIWPGVDHKKAVENLEGYDKSKHTILEIGSREKLYIGRNNIIDWCRRNNIKRFWMLDDDVTFRLDGPSQEFKDNVFKNEKYYLSNLEFDDDIGLGGMTSSGVMFNNTVDSPMYSNRFIWATIFIDLDYNDIKYSIEGYDDIDMQLECIKNNIKTQTFNWLGQAKPNWLTKKSLNSQIDKINCNNYLVYKKWGDAIRIDVYYDKNNNKYFRAHLRYPYKIENSLFTKYSTDSLESFIDSLEEAYRKNPNSFKVCGLPHMRTENKNKKEDDNIDKKEKQTSENHEVKKLF